MKVAGLDIPEEELSLIKARISYEYDMTNFEIISVVKSRKFINIDYFLSLAVENNGELIIFQNEDTYYYVIIRPVRKNV